MNLSREPAFGLMMLYRWPVLALLWIFVNVFMPSAASASSSSGVENRVWDFFAQEQVCVGSVATLSPGLHPGCELAYDDWTSGSPLAAKGGLSSRAARRQAMRDAGIPTSQQPVSQRSVRTPSGEPAGRQYDYDTPSPGGGTTRQSVQHSLTDDVPGHGPHWEAGRVKSGGRTDSLGRPRLQSGKAKVNEGG